jgi:hypothetical protein
LQLQLGCEKKGRFVCGLKPSFGGIMFMGTMGPSHGGGCCLCMLTSMKSSSMAAVTLASESGRGMVWFSGSK